MAQWQSTYLECLMSWDQSPALQQQQQNKTKTNTNLINSLTLIHEKKKKKRFLAGEMLGALLVEDGSLESRTSVFVCTST